MYILPLVQQQHGPQVTDSFVGESGRSDELQTFQLTKMRRISEMSLMSLMYASLITYPPDNRITVVNTWIQTPAYEYITAWRYYDISTHCLLP